MKFQEKNKKLENIFEFTSFKEALKFVNMVGEISEKNNHHPDISIFNYKFVKILLFTNDENKITEKDYELAVLIENIRKKLISKIK